MVSVTIKYIVLRGKKRFHKFSWYIRSKSADIVLPTAGGGCDGDGGTLAADMVSVASVTDIDRGRFVLVLGILLSGVTLGRAKRYKKCCTSSLTLLVPKHLSRTW